MSYRPVGSKLTAEEVPSSSSPQSNVEWSATNKWGVAFTVAGVSLIAIAGAAIAVYAAGKIPPGYHLPTKIAATAMGGVGLAGTIAGIVMIRHQSTKKEEEKKQAPPAQQTPHRPYQPSAAPPQPSTTSPQDRLQPYPQIFEPLPTSSLFPYTPPSSTFMGSTPPPSSSLSTGRASQIPSPFSPLPTASMPSPMSSALPLPLRQSPSAKSTDDACKQWLEIFNWSKNEHDKSEPPPVKLVLSADSPLNQEVQLTLINGDNHETLKDWSVRSLLELPSSHIFAPVKDQVVERLSQLNREIGCGDRVVCLRNPDFIRVGDLDAPWSRSPLKLHLMTKEQLQEVTIDEIASFTPRQLQVFISRYPQLKAEEAATAFSPRCTISQFMTLKPAEINTNLNIIHPNVIQFLTESQIRGLDTTKLTKQQFDSLFADTPPARLRIGWLTVSQVFLCIGLFDTNRIQYLTWKQLQDNDFDLKKLAKEYPSLFDTLFRVIGVDMGALEETRIKDLRLEQIYANLDLFTGARLRGMSPAQIRDFNYSTAGFIQEHFDGIFPEISKGMASSSKDFPERIVSARVQLLSRDQLYQVWNFLTGVRIGLITDTVLGELDFGAYPLTQAQFDILFPPASENSDINSQLHYTRLRQLKIGQVYSLLPLFDASRMRLLPQWFVKEFDFATHPLSNEQLSGLFYVPIKPTLADQELLKVRFDQLSVDQRQLYSLLPRLSGAQLSYLPKWQLEKIDFNQCKLRRDQLEGIIPPEDREKLRTQNLLQHSKISLFTPTQLNDLIILEENGQRILDGDRLFFINSKQLGGLNLSMLSDSQFEGLFPLSTDKSNQNVLEITKARIKSLEVGKLYANWERWQWRLKYLTPKQVEQIDFAKFKLGQDTFNLIFQKDMSHGSSHACVLSPEQIYALQDLFNEDQADYITVDQVSGMDFTKISAKKLLVGMFKATDKGFSVTTHRSTSRFRRVRPEQLHLVESYAQPWMVEGYKKTHNVS